MIFALLSKKSADAQGQVMLFTVLMISGTMLGATTIAGLLMLNQIRQTINVEQSVQASFSADAGVEWELYRLFKDSAYPKPNFDVRSEFITEVKTSTDEIEFRSVGCAGPRFPVLTDDPDQCPRPVHRSYQLFFELVT